MARSDRVLLLCGLVAWTVACKDDASASANPGPSQTGDAGAASGNLESAAPIGARCEGAPDACDQGDCRDYLSYEVVGERALGFCSRSCSAAEDCPSGFRCTQSLHEKLCLPRCADHPECDRFQLGWKCAEAQGDRVCANPATRGGEIALRTQIVIDRIAFGTAEQAWRFVPGVWADVKILLVNKGSSGPLKAPTGPQILISESEWVEVGNATATGTQVRTLPGVPLGEPQHLSISVADPLGTGSIKVPFFIRSLASGLALKPTVAVASAAAPGQVDVAGYVTGFGTAPALVNTHNAASAPWAMNDDPWLAEARPFYGMGSIEAPGAAPGAILGITIAEPTGSSWEGPVTVVPSVGNVFWSPDPIRRPALAGGATVSTGFRVRDATKLQQAGPKTHLTFVSDQPWAKLMADFADAWNGDTFVYVEVSEPPDPVSSRAFITVSWSGIEIGRVPIMVLPSPQ